MKYVISDLAPLDRCPPGTDVTGKYSPAKLEELEKRGYVVKVPMRKTAKRKKKAKVKDDD